MNWEKVPNWCAGRWLWKKFFIVNFDVMCVHMSGVFWGWCHKTKAKFLFLFFCSKMSFLTLIFFGGAHLSQSTVYLEVSTYLLQTLVYNLQLPCVHPLTSLCTTSNFLVFFPSGVSVYIICFWLFPYIPSFLEVMIHDKWPGVSDISGIPVTLQWFSN